MTDSELLWILIVEAFLFLVSVPASFFVARLYGRLFRRPGDPFVAYMFLMGLSWFLCFEYWAIRVNTEAGISGTFPIGFILFVAIVLLPLLGMGLWFLMDRNKERLVRGIQAAQHICAIPARGAFKASLYGIEIVVTRFSEGKQKPLVRVKWDEARASAAERRAFIETILNEHRREPARFEILETPPGFEETPRYGPLDDLSSNAQMVQLLYQTESEQALLFGRAADAVICIARRPSADYAVSTPAKIDIALRRAHWWERRSDRFPWIVVIATDNPALFKYRLRELRSWLGVNINIRPFTSMALQRQCRHSNERGTVAGLIRSPSEGVDYAVTCAHVIPRNCIETRIPSNVDTVGTPGQPDVTLLKMHDCVGPRRATAVLPIYRRMRGQVIAAKRAVVRVGGYSPRVQGYVKYELRQFQIEGVLHRFPACTIEMKRVKYCRGIPWPLRKKPFSLDGDSGSWVILDDSSGRRWLGMIVAGDGKESTVMLGSALIWYFRRTLSIRPLIPACLGESNGSTESV